MLKISQDQFDTTLNRVMEELDKERAAEWKTLAIESKPLLDYATMFSDDFVTPFDAAAGFLLSGINLGYELAKTEAANERAQIIAKSEALG